MEKLSSVIAEIEEQAQTQKKVASDLSEQKTLPTISTALGKSLVKFAEDLKTSSAIIDYLDLQDFLKRIQNA